MALSFSFSKKVRQTMMIPAQGGAGFQLKRGDQLKVISPQGEQVCDLFCFSAANPADALSSGRSIDYEDTLFFTTGHRLYSQSGQIMFEILEDTCGRHDFLVTPCSCQMFQMIAGNDKYHPSCLENLEMAFKPYAVNPAQIGTTFNIFMNVQIRPDGRIKVSPPLSRAQDFVRLQAQMDLVVGLTACADEGSNNGSCKPIAYEIIPNEKNL